MWVGGWVMIRSCRTIVSKCAQCLRECVNAQECVFGGGEGGGCKSVCAFVCVCVCV